jgi:stage II sporulation protein D
MLLLVAPAPPFTAPTFEGDLAAQPQVEEALRAAFLATSAQGRWPSGRWRIHLHPDAATFERATGAPPGRSGQWLGDTLHLRPWEQLRRRDLGAVLRHELTHRRLQDRALRRWEEEARCLWAEGHRKPLVEAGPRPSAALQERLDRALAGGSTRTQAWAYRWLRAWLRREPLPEPPGERSRSPEVWTKEALALAPEVTVQWPAERLRGPLVVNGQRLSHRSGRTWRFQGTVRFQAGFPVNELTGTVRLRAEPAGWSLVWRTSRTAWIAAATDGELGADAPFEARRALAALLGRWLEGHGRQHPGGALCPLTHCAVVRGVASPETRRAAAAAPALDLDPRWAFFTGSAGGHPLAPRAVWGRGPAVPGAADSLPEDRWRDWERTLSGAQVAALKRDVRPGVAEGQRSLHLGDSGPYAVEALRLAAGRRFGWTAWPSNACVGEVQIDGALHLRGHGWGHNVGLCLATARSRAAAGATAEQILAEAFPASWRTP